MKLIRTIVILIAAALQTGCKCGSHVAWTLYIGDDWNGCLRISSDPLEPFPDYDPHEEVNGR